MPSPCHSGTPRRQPLLNRAAQAEPPPLQMEFIVFELLDKELHIFDVHHNNPNTSQDDNDNNIYDDNIP